MEVGISHELNLLMKKCCQHIALTGPPGIGKTTLVQNLVNQLHQQGVPCYGFVTEEVRNQGKRIGFDILTLDGRRATLARISQFSVLKDQRSRNQCTVGPYIVDVNSFESLVLPLLSSNIPQNCVLVIDEIGKMEMCSHDFVSKMKQLINSTRNPMLLTIPVPKGRPISFIQEIRNHNAINILTVSFANREDLIFQKEIVTSLMRNVKTTATT